ncbi:MAG: HNH endonuclease signature motif containing protein [Dehalococcoidales bacterium]
MIPQIVRDAILDRSGGLCESCGQQAQDLAHITDKKMGGRHGAMQKIINDPRNIAALCRPCHDLLHHKRKESFPGERLGVLQKIKIKTDWNEWRREFENYTR